MPNARTTLLITAIDEAFSSHAEAILKPCGWQIEKAANAEAVCDRITASTPAAVLIDGQSIDAAKVVAAVRHLAPPLNGTPILAVGKLADGVAGAGGCLDAPLAEDPLVSLLRQWAGPLAAHGLREAPWHFRYRLLRLIGLQAADAMLLRLRDALQHAIAPDESVDPVSAHRLAGIAGMCGFPELSQQWNAADRGEDGALAAAIDASLQTIARIDDALADKA